jgi:hypothetical protein
MIKWVINDFKSMRASLSYMAGRNIPMWISIPYYIVGWMIALPFVPFVLVWSKIQMRKLNKELEA